MIQLESKGKPAADSPLTPELKEFIDRAIVPGLVKLWLDERSAEKKLAEETAGIGESTRSTATLPGQVRP